MVETCSTHGTDKKLHKISVGEREGKRPLGET